MITKENLNKLYELVADDLELTTKVLLECGFHSYDINMLIKDNQIDRVKRGCYKLKSALPLYNRYKELISCKQYDIALKYLDKAYEMEPSNIQTCLSLIHFNLYEKNIEKAVWACRKSYNLGNEEYRCDLNFFLYLFGVLTNFTFSNFSNINSIFKEKVKELEIEDILVSKLYSNSDLYNNIRVLAFEKNFIYAYKVVGKMKKENKYPNTVSNLIVEELLFNIQKRISQRISICLNLVKEKKYEEALEVMEENDSKKILDVYEQDIIFILKDIINIKKNRVIPKQESSRSRNLHDIIRNRKYKIALLIKTKKLEEKNFKRNTNVILTLLIEINRLIEELEQEKSPLKSTDEESSNINNSESTLDNESRTCQYIIHFLKENDLDKALVILRNYLYSLGKARYEFIIVNLIKVSLLENDTEFKRVKDKINEIIKIDYQFSLYEYINNFYNALANNEINIAKVYLDIIINTEKIDIECVLTNSLKAILEKTAKQIKYRFNYSVDNTINTSLIKVTKMQSDGVTITDLVKEDEKLSQDEVNLAFEEEENDLDNSYGVDNVEEIIISVFNGKTFDEACNTFNLDSNSKLKVALIFAKQCYSLEEYEQGDDYLKIAKSYRNKIEEEKVLFEEITKNKTFYKNLRN